VFSVPLWLFFLSNR